MENILLISMVVVAVLIIIVVLLQKSSSMGLGAYSGSNDSVFGAKGPASFLSKATFFLGTLFVVLVIWLGVVYNQASSASIMDNTTDVNAAPTVAPATDAATPADETNAAPAVPQAPETK